jgi:hypothetical protein
MMIRIDLAGLRRTKWQDYAIRFLFGGLITAAAGLIAQRWGRRWTRSSRQRSGDPKVRNPARVCISLC